MYSIYKNQKKKKKFQSWARQAKIRKNVKALCLNGVATTNNAIMKKQIFFGLEARGTCRVCTALEMDKIAVFLKCFQQGVVQWAPKVNPASKVYPPSEFFNFLSTSNF